MKVKAFRRDDGTVHEMAYDLDRAWAVYCFRVNGIDEVPDMWRAGDDATKLAQLNAVSKDWEWRPFEARAQSVFDWAKIL